MSFADDLKRGIGIVFSPQENAKKGMPVIKALRFYYEFSLLPLVAFTVIGLLVAYFNGNVPSYAMTLPLLYNPAFSIITIVIKAIALFWILVPVGFFISAAIYQLVGYNFLHAWKGNYAKTFSAVMFGELPVILFYWLVPLPILGVIALMVLAIWQIVVLVIALSNIQMISRLAAIGAIFVSIALAIIVVMLLFSLFMAPLLALGGMQGLNAYNLNGPFVPMMH
ncbi:MAG: hypothetical protein ACP5NE_00570 [Candidatus Micrarchaeia archaeon]